MDLETLKEQWLKADGSPMPDNIASLPLDRIRRAVDLTEKGITVVVPKTVAAVKVAEESMVAWDRHKEF